MGKINIHNLRLRRGFGWGGALLQIGLLFSDYAEQDLYTLMPVRLAFALFFIASAVFASMGKVQAPLCLALCAIETNSSLNCYEGLGFSLIAAVIFLLRGLFYRKAMLRAAILSSFGGIALVLPIAISNKQPLCLASASIAALIFALVVFAMARGRVLGSFSLEKPVLKLSACGLNKREIQIVKAKLGGKTVKDFARENDIAASTVRNSLASATHKLGLNGREALGALGERFRVE
jgi:DNA-binding CsgD family transcriptional regulator